jgi:hypothetical protein
MAKSISLAKQSPEMVAQGSPALAYRATGIQISGPPLPVLESKFSS